MKESYERIMKPLSVFFTVFGLLVGLIFALNYFGYSLLQGAGVLGFLLVAQFSVIVALVYIILENPERMMEGLGSTSILSRTVVKQIENCMEKKEFRSAILLARSMSRPLWLEGRYKERLRLGELLQQAASSSRPPDLPALTQSLIDELGWTNVELNNLEEASKNVNQGIQYAKQLNDAYMIARGYRHLSGVAQRKGDKEKAEDYLNLAEKTASNIADRKRQREMLAGINFGRGDLCLMSNERVKTEQAKDYFLAAKAIQEEFGDRERLIKTSMRLGQVHQRLGESAKANEYYCQSLQSAKELGWPQQICEINIHLGRLMLEENMLTDALRAFEEAKTIAKYINLDNLCEEADVLLRTTQTKLKQQK